MKYKFNYFLHIYCVGLLYLLVSPAFAELNNFSIVQTQQTLINNVQNTQFIESPSQSKGAAILPPEKAFQLSTEVSDDDMLIVQWKMAHDIYLYEAKLSFDVLEGGELGTPQIPDGLLKEDAVFGKQIVHYSPLTIKIPVIQRSSDHLLVNVSYQGCSEHGFCYPPITEKALLNFHMSSDQAQVTWNNDEHSMIASPTLAKHEQITALLLDQNLLVVMLTFLGFGILLTFTPCVLPMVPILASVIVGSRKTISKRRAFALSSAYVLGMVVCYTVLGVLAGLAGNSLQAAFQKTWVIVTISGLFVLLALAMFNLYQLRLPSSLETRLVGISQRQKGGTYLGVLFMGGVSALIVSPCVSAPLVGALAYISQSGDASLGGFALANLSIGMGIPLILASTFGAHYLPKSGAWMDIIKAIFGVLLLGVAIWMLERVLSGTLILFLWAALLMVSAVYLGVFEPGSNNGWERFWKGVGCISFAYGLILLLGASMGNNNPLRPLDGIKLTNAGNQLSQPMAAVFKPVKSILDVNQQLSLAQQAGKPVMLDFYADWCSACIIMQRTTFADPDIQASLAQHFIVLQADVTANDAIDRALQRHFSVFAPPSLLFFSPDGKEIQSAKLVGEIGPRAFNEHLNRVLEMAMIPKKA